MHVLMRAVSPDAFTQIQRLDAIILELTRDNAVILMCNCGELIREKIGYALHVLHKVSEMD